MNRNLLAAVIVIVAIAAASFLNYTGMIANGKEPKPGYIRSFDSLNNAEICMEDWRPIVRLFCKTSDPHCQWISETYDSVVMEYMNLGRIKAYHWNIDTGDDALTALIETEVPESEMELFRHFSPERVPTFVFGCMYHRIENGYEKQNNLMGEELEFREIIENLLRGVY